MMKYGQYAVESIEADKVKLLFSEDESIVELLSATDFPFVVKEGDLVSIQLNECETAHVITLLEKETEAMRTKVSDMLEKLKSKNK